MATRQVYGNSQSQTDTWSSLLTLGPPLVSWTVQEMACAQALQLTTHHLQLTTHHRMLKNAGCSAKSSNRPCPTKSSGQSDVHFLAKGSSSLAIFNLLAWMAQKDQKLKLLETL